MTVAEANPLPAAQSLSASPAVLLPQASGLFATRARRLRQLAAGHSLGEFLQFAAAICDAQEQLLGSPHVPYVIDLPDARGLALARTHRMPVLPAHSAQRSGDWHILLRELAEALRGSAPPPTVAVIDQLQRAGATELEGLADAALGGQWEHPQRAALPLVSATLQAVWSAAAARLDASTMERLEVAELCPVCGSLPVAGIIRTGMADSGLRYLHCSLCNAEWHVVRATCVQCHSADGHAYTGIEGTAQAVVGETCDSCKSYLKLCRMDKDPEVDPLADDLATLTLDILLDERGYGRIGPNPFLIPGPA